MRATDKQVISAHGGDLGRRAPDAGTRRIARHIGAVLLCLLALWTLRSYLAALGWAVIIALSVWPVYDLMRMRIGGGRVAAPLLATCGLAVILAVPFVLAMVSFGREAQTLLQWITHAQQNGIPVPEWVRHLPVLGQNLDTWWQAHLSQPQSAGQWLNGLDPETLTGWSRTLGGAALAHLLHALICFMALFLLLRDGDRIGAQVLDLTDRWLGTPGERLAEKMTVAVRGTVNGTVLVAVGEGILIGIGFVLAGVPHAVLFAILTMAFAMLPMGAWFAFGVAAAVLLMAGGSIIAAAAVFGWGALVMLVGDNVVQPGLIGGAARLPFLWALVGILGGLETFGLIGLFLGPVIMAALLTIWRSQVGTPREAGLSVGSD
ncbi:AI-2E family transporter [Microvirga rosea]|uniref:AI-2E family transporter n=1 Tax=Microvirga rosea TaxID=2715425 RepID=UPI001D0A09EF|nr:AI-2E family transporter [Microvirga rosea]MCB8819263.1 AI-2E family transporter [Microvirga rosea]